jgi:hypothetical protein
MQPPALAGPVSTSKLEPPRAIHAILWCPDGKKDNGEWRWAAPIDGKTRLVKELFLFQEETKSGAEGTLTFKFSPGLYGPSSVELTRALDDLISLGEVSTLPLGAGRGVQLRLAPPGGRKATEEWRHLPDQVRADLYRIKSRLAGMTYRQFMLYIYRTYPEFTENSLIRQEVFDEPNE